MFRLRLQTLAIYRNDPADERAIDAPHLDVPATCTVVPVPAFVAEVVLRVLALRAVVSAAPVVASAAVPLALLIRSWEKCQVYAAAGTLREQRNRIEHGHLEYGQSMRHCQ